MCTFMGELKMEVERWPMGARISSENLAMVCRKI